MLSVIIVIFIIIVFWCYTDTKKPIGFPPGPTWWPVFGNVYSVFQELNLIKYHHIVWAKLAKKYGPVLGLRLGRQRIIIVSGLEAIKAVCSKEEFDGRPDGFFFQFRTWEARLGVVFTDGSLWEEHRRFTTRHLRSRGFGKQSLAELVENETIDLIHILKEKCSEPMFMHQAFDISVLNVLWAMTAGKRFQLNDQRLYKLLDLVHESFRAMDMSGGTINQLPVLRYIVPNLIGYTHIKNSLYKDGLYAFLQETVDEHRSMLCSDSTHDLIDAYLQRMEEEQGRETTFTDHQLLSVLLDMFQAGSETTSNTLGFIILYMLLHPEIQDKARSEIDRIVGRDRLPNLSDKPSYVEAVILEVQRCAQVVPIGVPHRAMETGELLGHTIPKGSTILLSLHSMYMDKKHWGDPEVFRPERFIDESGKLIQDEWMIPFGIGKRRCLGETIAKASMFVMFSAMLHTFILEPSGVIDAEGLNGVTISPKPFKAFLKLRD